MSDQVQATPATQSPFARLVGVIVSPAETFKEVERRPGWLFPMICYLVVFVVAFGVYGMKADWVAIVEDQIRNTPGLSFLPEEQVDKAISEATGNLRKQTQFQRAAGNVLNVTTSLLPFFHGMALVYCSLFVFMGSLTALRLGKAWLNFLLGLLLYIGYLGVAFVSQMVFADAPASALILLAVAGVVLTGAWIWLLNRQTQRDETFHKMLSVCTYATAISIIGGIAILAISLASQDAIQVSVDSLVKANPGAWLKPESPVLRAVLDRLDLFTLWFLAVLTIGFRAVTKLSAGLAASITLLPWGIYALIRIAMAAAFG